MHSLETWQNAGVAEKDEATVQTKHHTSRTTLNHSSKIPTGEADPWHFQPSFRMPISIPISMTTNLIEALLEVVQVYVHKMPGRRGARDGDDLLLLPI